MKKQTVRDIKVEGQRVLVRVDFNVPQDEAGNITDDTRIVASLPTIRYLIERRASVILMSHLGRPKGVVAKLSLSTVARRLAELLGQPVDMAPDCVGLAVKEMAHKMGPGDVLLLENLRFHPEEETNDPEFARQLAELGDLYVNDAFGTAHRAHASTAGVAAFLPAVAGFLMEREIETMSAALEQPARPFVAVVGGAKVSTKMGVLHNLLGKVDRLLIGGGMACTFLKAQGYEVGKSLLEQDRLADAARLLAESGDKLVLPLDAVVADRLDAQAKTETVLVEQVPTDRLIADIGPRTRQWFAMELSIARTILWNGPVGVFEIAAFAGGTKAIADAVARSGAISIIGGGDTVAAIEQMGYADRFTHVSTGGGASLEFLEGKVLPGIAALRDR